MRSPSLCWSPGPLVPGAGAVRSPAPTCAAASSRRGRGTVPRGLPPVPPPPRPAPRPRPRRAPPPPRAAGPRAGRAPPRTSRALSQVNTAGSTQGKFYGDRRERGRGRGLRAAPRPGNGHLRIPAEPRSQRNRGCFAPGLDSPLPRGSGSPAGSPRGNRGVRTHGGWQSGNKPQRCLCPIVSGLAGVSVVLWPPWGGQWSGTDGAGIWLGGNEILRQRGRGWAEGRTRCCPSKNNSALPQVSSDPSAFAGCAFIADVFPFCLFDLRFLPQPLGWFGPGERQRMQVGISGLAGSRCWVGNGACCVWGATRENWQFRFPLDASPSIVPLGTADK